MSFIYDSVIESLSDGKLTIEEIFTVISLVVKKIEELAKTDKNLRGEKKKAMALEILERIIDNNSLLPLATTATFKQILPKTIDMIVDVANNGLLLKKSGFRFQLCFGSCK